MPTILHRFSSPNKSEKNEVLSQTSSATKFRDQLFVSFAKKRELDKIEKIDESVNEQNKNEIQVLAQSEKSQEKDDEKSQNDSKIQNKRQEKQKKVSKKAAATSSAISLKVVPTYQAEQKEVNLQDSEIVTEKKKTVRTRGKKVPTSELQEQVVMENN